MAGMPKQTPLPFPDADPARPNPTEPSSATPSGPAPPAETGAGSGDLAVAAEPAHEVVEPTAAAPSIEDSEVEDAVAPPAAEAAVEIESTSPQPDPAQTELPIGAVAPRPGLDVRQYQSRRPWW